MNNKNILAKKLLDTGWQSWSSDYKAGIFKLPLSDFPPRLLDDSEIIINHNGKIKLKPPVKGWCSWTAFGTSINEKIILKQAGWFKKNSLKSFEYILIDDGWESALGDWKADETKFPHGLKYMSESIEDLGLKPGIWLAPFSVDSKSDLAKKHPDWIIKNSRTHGIKNFISSPRRYFLDIANPEVVKYIFDTLDLLLKDYKFKLIKLDFLYGIYFNPKSTIKTADEFLRSFFLRIRRNYPDVYTIASGCPLIPAVGVVDSMRIGPDALIPDHKRFPGFKYVSNLYQYKKVIKSAAFRTWTNKLWNVDLDAFVCDKNLGLSDKQIFNMHSLIKKSGGNIFLGDDMTSLPHDRIEKFIKDF